MPLNIETFLITFWTDLFYGFVFVYSLFMHCKVKGMLCFKFAHVAQEFLNFCMHSLNVFLHCNFLNKLVTKSTELYIQFHPLLLRKIALCSLNMSLKILDNLATVRTSAGAEVSVLQVMREVIGGDKVSTQVTRLLGFGVLRFNPSSFVPLVINLDVSIKSSGGGKLLWVVRTNNPLIMCQDVFVKSLEISKVSPAISAKRPPVLFKLVSLERPVPLGHKVTAITKLS